MTCVRWQSCISTVFTVRNGTRQGGVLSPLLFIRYIKQILDKVVCARLECNIGGVFMNILACAELLMIL